MIEKTVYICHQYGGKPKNKAIVTELLRALARDYPKICFMSPIHAFGCLYDFIPYSHGMAMCYTLLDLCDEMWTYGKNSMSKGCMLEKEYCEKYHIPIIERVRHE
jgi:hypothetical protein